MAAKPLSAPAPGGVAGHAVEIRSYDLRPGTRPEFHRLATDQALPMLRRWRIDVVAAGPSPHDTTSYYLIRAYASLEDRQQSEDRFYGSTEWREGPREPILALIESYTTVVLELDDRTLAGLRQAPLPGAVREEAVVTTRASGTFDVKLNPQPTADSTEGATIGRMSIDKWFHGDLEATSKGEMLTAGTGVEGSAGYVAIERVSGTPHGRSGTFVLQHSGTMTRGAPQLTITVVPDSGTDELLGLAGRMVITIAGGKHSYDFEYTLAGKP